MPRGDKSKYIDKQERKADHIAEGYETRGVPEQEAERRCCWPLSNCVVTFMSKYNKLSKYRSKRDFTRTAEPNGQTKITASNRRRFIVQKHAATRLHYDLRLELDGVFKSWAVTRGPSLDPHDKRLAVEVEDHPLDYGDFEGTIPKGEYGGGTVQLWDRGYWEPEGNKTPRKSLLAATSSSCCRDSVCTAAGSSSRMKHDRIGGKRTNWLLIKHRDEHAREGGANAVLAEDCSIASGRSMAAIAAGKGHGPKSFMLAEPDAVWNSRTGHGAERSQKAQGWLGQDKVTDVEGTATILCCASGLHSAPALRAGRAAAVRRWLGTRGQVRWLSYSAPCAEWTRDLEDA